MTADCISGAKGCGDRVDISSEHGLSFLSFHRLSQCLGACRLLVASRLLHCAGTLPAGSKVARAGHADSAFVLGVCVYGPAFVLLINIESAFTMHTATALEYFLRSTRSYVCEKQPGLDSTG